MKSLQLTTLIILLTMDNDGPSSGHNSYTPYNIIMTRHTHWQTDSHLQWCWSGWCEGLTLVTHCPVINSGCLFTKILYNTQYISYLSTSYISMECTYSITQTHTHSYTTHLDHHWCGLSSYDRVSSTPNLLILIFWSNTTSAHTYKQHCKPLNYLVIS